MAYTGTRCNAALQKRPQFRSRQRVPDLGYADDCILPANSPEGLQKMIDVAAEFCASIGMQPSTEKTKALNFSSFLQDPFQWHCLAVTVG